MTIRGTTILAVTVAFGVGYFKGLNDADKIHDGMVEIGQGLKDLAKEIGIEYKKSQEEDKPSDGAVDGTVEEPVAVAGEDPLQPGSDAT